MLYYAVKHTVKLVKLPLMGDEESPLTEASRYRKKTVHKIRHKY